MRDKEKQIAQRLLEHRRRGYSIGLAVRSMRRRYIVSGALWVLLICLAFRQPDFVLIWIGIGLYGGMLLRDIGWFTGIKKLWPFTEKVTDWEKVEAIARGEDGQ